MLLADVRDVRGCCQALRGKSGGPAAGREPPETVADWRGIKPRGRRGNVAGRGRLSFRCRVWVSLRV